MAETAVLHVDKIASVGFERVTRVGFGEPVLVNELPVGAARQHAPGQQIAKAFAPLALAAEDRHDPPAALAHGSNLERGAHQGTNFERQLEKRGIHCPASHVP